MNSVYLSNRQPASQLFPFAQVRAVADIRVGILTIREKWERFFGAPVYMVDEEENLPSDATIFSANVVPSSEFFASLKKADGVLNPDPAWDNVKVLQLPWHIFQFNDWALRQDFIGLTKGRVSAPIPDTVRAIGPENIFIEPGAKLSYCLLNASTGPIYIGAGTEIMEEAAIRGPFALCEGAVVKMGARIYGATTIGPYCVAGGEIKNAVMFGYSNKGHDGYLGDAVLGEWCNLGAGTSNSNIKNNAGDVRVWHNSTRDYVSAGQKCGLLMGDYSRSAINTSFNTGTVVGICTNVFGEGLLPKLIPNFTWGSRGLSKYEFDKALTDIANWKKLKNQELTRDEIRKLKHIFETE